MTPYFSTESIDLYLGDCLEIMPSLPDRSIDFICVDLPYGVTACEWDNKLPLDRLWAEWKRLIKPKGAIALFGTQPFTSELVMSNREWFRYEWIWEKTIGNNFLMAKKQPLRKHENLIVFSEGQTIYNPQMEEGEPYVDNPRKRLHRVIRDSTIPNLGIVNDGTRYPSSVQKFANPNNEGLHPTQKPIALLQYLIRTYTNEGDTVFDCTCGSGSLLVAAQSLNRKAVGIELDPEFCAIAAQRLGSLEPQRIQAEAAKTGQYTIFDALEAAV